jgi:hypothetical protein
MRRFMLLTIVTFLGCTTVFGQANPYTIQYFPQFADGRFADGTFYRSTLMVMPVLFVRDVACSFDLHGVPAAFEDFGMQSTINFSLPPGAILSTRTTGSQTYRGGYATLTCSVPVYASVLLGYYAANSTKVSEATVLGVVGLPSWTLVVDQRDGARLGMAIANFTDAPQTLTFTFTGSGNPKTAQTTLPPAFSLAKFVDEFLTSLPVGAVGRLTIASDNGAAFAVTGLRFSGNAFTTIPANPY